MEENTMTAQLVPDEQKLAELILYISQKCANDLTFGAVKLNKILCFSDFVFYAYHNRGITNVEYQKLPNGPAPRRLMPVRDKLVENGDLAIQEVALKGGYTQKRTVNLRKPNLEIFTGAEIAMVDSVIESLQDVRAESASEMSHDLVGWLVVDEGETIPYNTIYFANPPLTEDESNRARELKEAKQNPKGIKDAKRRDIRRA
jgi:antitoxin SocA-like protein